MIEMIEPVDLQDRAEIHGTTVLVEYNKTEAGLAALREDLKGKTYDLATTKGNEAARADRLRCVTLRTTLEKTRKAFKAPALAYGKKIDAEAERITAEIEALEKPIDEQIRADEARREAEREAKRQAEAARVQAHEANIARIHAFLPACNGKDSTRITRGMELLGEFEPDGTWEEFEDRGKQAKAETLAAMKVIYDRTKAAEDAAAALEAQRQEQERVAAELAKQQDEINRQRAELERQQREIIEAAEAEKRAKFEAESRQIIADSTGILRDTGPTEAAPGPVSTIHQTDPGMVMTDCTLTDAITRKDTTAQQEAGQAATQGTETNPSPCQAQTSWPEPTIKLGEISQRLGFTLTEVFIRETLHIEPCGNDKRAVLFKASDFARICAALINHLGRLA